MLWHPNVEMQISQCRVWEEHKREAGAMLKCAGTCCCRGDGVLA